MYVLEIKLKIPISTPFKIPIGENMFLNKVFYLYVKYWH